MGHEEFLRNAEKVIAKTLPRGIDVTKVELEAANVVIFTKQIEEFSKGSDLVKQLAHALHKRVLIRPDKSILKPVEAAQKILDEIIPKDAGVTDVWFNPATGEVSIEALNPGAAIGRHGAILTEVRKRIGWSPQLMRAPPIPSKTVAEIRSFLRMVTEERQEFLHRLSRRILRDVGDSQPYARLTMLGAYREVGRSATLLTTNISKVIIDCGVKFAPGSDDSPYLSAPEVLPIESLDAMVLTHAHLDHSCMLPALYKFGYQGAVYCTPPTRELASLLQLDYIKVSSGEGKVSAYDSSHIREAVKRTITLGYGETTDISPDIRLTFQNAGHILGSAVAHFHIGDGLHNIAMSGDMKYERSWLFDPTTDHFPRLETLVMESTYGAQNDFQPSRQEAGDELRSIIGRSLARGGNVLLPVFAVGRSQEVMLVLEEIMRSGQIPKVPVYLDGMIWEATAIHTAYPEYLNNQLREMILTEGHNPFLEPMFHKVESQMQREQIINGREQCIVLATSGMLSGGPIMEYFKSWAEGENNVIIFVGFNAEGTMGRRIQRGLAEFSYNDRGQTTRVPCNLQVETVDGFSGHSDRGQLMNWIANLSPRPERIIIGHGEPSKSVDLASSLHKKYGIETRVPQNLETIRLC